MAPHRLYGAERSRAGRAVHVVLGPVSEDGLRLPTPRQGEARTMQATAENGVRGQRDGRKQKGATLSSPLSVTGLQGALKQV